MPGLSVRDNITLGIVPSLARFGMLAGNAQDAIADDLIGRLRIKTSGRDQKISELSGGNQQKVLLARMLAMTPRLLILDDPTRGIDVGAKAEIQALVSELARQGLSVRPHQLRPGGGRGGLRRAGDPARWGGRRLATGGDVSAERVVGAHRGRGRWPGDTAGRCAATRSVAHD